MTRSSEKTKRSLGHILVAEDDVIAQMVVTKMVEQAGYTMDLAVDGLEVVSAMESKHYDLILMDCLMPRMSGFDATRVIRNSDSPAINSGIPIIAMTGLTAEDDLDRCLESGMYEVISKPFSLADLVPVLRHCMAKNESAGLALKQPEGEQQETWDDGFLDNVIDKFLTEVPRVISELQEAVNQADAEKLRNIAHRFRGATDILHVSGLSARSRALENAASAGATELAVTHATELIEEMQKLLLVLAE